MQFRTRGKTVRAVRPAAGDTPSEVVATLSGDPLTLSDEDRAKFSEEELAEVEAYIARTDREHALEREYAAAHFGENIDLVMDWIAAADPDTAKEFAESVSRKTTRLRRELVRLLNEGEEGAEAAA